MKISFFGFGGGNAVMPLIKNEVVVKKRWITEDEFNHLLICQIVKLSATKLFF
ncbi:chromate transporter [Spiroplasma endosymbiont of Nephrotoma flavescens]|uniref:chromate transporter n=1 Tax=Spiroplasma endosymbiont of Nephrotoma flavescens TaxID=3066302 RepID=UPI00313C232C